MDELNLVRKAICAILPTQVSAAGEALQPRELYIPPAHRKALQLYSDIVVGDRGVGKSTWTLALANPQLQEVIGANIGELKNVLVHIGFAVAQDVQAYPDADIIKSLLKKEFGPYNIWKTVVIRWLSHEISKPITTESWEVSALWVRDNPEPCAKIMEEANNYFKESGKNGLILFDALDRLSDRWEEMDTLVKELLRLVLSLKAFSNIYAKVFLRPDQLSRTTTAFPDSSKLLTTQTVLNWGIHDLHGLLWQQLCNAPGEGGDILRQYYKEAVGVTPSKSMGYWEITDNIKNDNKNQRALFEKLAGPWMGKDKRRGVPYVWTVGHLADGNKHTSPRSFLNAIQTAAEKSMDRRSEYPLHYESIKSGVQSASQIRVNEIAEDYKWIGTLCTPLAGMNVPISFVAIQEKWQEEYPGGPNTIQAALFPRALEDGWKCFRDELIRLGVFEEMRDGRINMPDLFRVGFKLGRKGGVPPVR